MRTTTQTQPDAAPQTHLRSHAPTSPRATSDQRRGLRPHFFLAPAPPFRHNTRNANQPDVRPGVRRGLRESRPSISPRVPSSKYVVTTIDISVSRVIGSFLQVVAPPSRDSRTKLGCSQHEGIHDVHAGSSGMDGGMATRAQRSQLHPRCAGHTMAISRPQGATEPAPGIRHFGPMAAPVSLTKTRNRARQGPE